MEKTKPRTSNRSRKQRAMFTIAEELPKKERKKRRISDNENNEKSKEQKLSPAMEEISFRIGVVNAEAVNQLSNGSKCHACGHLVPSSEWRPESRLCHSCARKPLPSSASSSSSLSTIDRHLLSPIDRSKKPRSPPSPSRSPRPIEDNEVTVQDKGDIALEKLNKIPSHRWYPFKIASSASQSAIDQLMNWSSSSDETIDEQSFISDGTQSFGEMFVDDNRPLTEMSDELPSVPVPGEAMIAVPSARPLLDSVQSLLGRMMFVEEGAAEEQPYDAAVDNEKSSSQMIRCLDTLTSLLSFGPSILHPSIVIALINRLIAPRTPTFCATTIFEFLTRHANGCRRTAAMTSSSEKILRLSSIWHPSVCQLQSMTALCGRAIGIINRKKREMKEGDLLLLYKSKLVIELFLDSLGHDFIITPSTNTYIHRAKQSPLFSSPLNQCFQSLRQCIDAIKTKLSKASPISDEQLPIIYSMHHQITQFFQQIDRVP